MNILIDAFRYRVEQKQVQIYAFVIMPNHFHVIWTVLEPKSPADFQRDFLKATAKRLLKNISETEPNLLPKFISTQRDRKYHVWERRGLGIPIYKDEVLFQKMNYIHYNPCNLKWKLADRPEDYFYSSAGFYLGGRNDFDFLTHIQYYR